MLPLAVDAPPLSLAPEGACDSSETAIITEADASALLTDDTHVYVAERGEASCDHRGCTYAGGPLRRIERCTGTAEVLAEGQHDIEQWVDGGSVVYAIGKAPDSPVIRVDKTTRAMTELDLCVEGAAANATHLFFGDPCDSSIRSLAHDATEPETVAALFFAPTHLAVAGGNLYYGGLPEYASGLSTSIVRRNIDTGGTQTVHVTDRVISGLAAASDRMFFVSNALANNNVVEYPGEGDLWQVGRDDVAAESVLTLTGGTPLLTDRDTLYLSRPNALHSLETYASEAPPLLRASPPHDVHEGRIYWSAAGYLLTKAPSSERATGSLGPDAEPLAEVQFEGELSFGEVVVAPDGGIALLAEFHGGPADLGNGPTAADEGAILASFDAGFELQYAIELPRQAYPRALAADGSGKMHIVTDSGSGDDQWETYDTDGTHLGAIVSAPRLSHLQATPWGSFLLVAESAVVSFPRSSELRSYTPDGSLEWSVPLDPAARVVEIASTRSGSIVIAGNFPGTQSAYSLDRSGRGFVIELDRDGHLVGQQEIERSTLSGAGVDGSGRIVVTGTAEGWFDVGRGTEVVAVPGRENSVVAAFDADGALRWVRTFEGGPIELDSVSADGSIVLRHGSTEELDFAPLGGPRVDEAVVFTLDASGALVATVSAVGPATLQDGHLVIASPGLTGPSAGGPALRRY